MKPRASLMTLSAVLLVLAGCGDDDKPDSSSGLDLGDTSSCADLDGQTMPENYEGCTVDDEVQAALVYDDCENGKVLIGSGPVYGYVGEPMIYSPEDGGVDGAGFEKLWNECYGYEDAEPDDAEPSAVGDLPACDEVWVVGENLPADYTGCDRDGTTTADIGVECQDGSTLYVLENAKTGEDQFFGITGQQIGNADDDGADDGPYAVAYNACAGEG